MIKKVIKFLDKHRFILVLVILLFISLLFVSIGSIIFFHHDFKPLECSAALDEDTCYYHDLIIFRYPKNSEKKFFQEFNSAINDLKDKYQLPEFNIYTAYFYEMASLIDFNMNEGSKELYTFFNRYSNTYNLQKFYQKYSFFYDIYYNYKIKIN